MPDAVLSVSYVLDGESRVEANVFRASVPVCSGGMLSVCTDHATGAVYCGGGNGVIRKVKHPATTFALLFSAIDHTSAGQTLVVLVGANMTSSVTSVPPESTSCKCCHPSTG